MINPEPFYQAGISVIPVDVKTKRPTCKWKPMQDEIIPTAFKEGEGIAIVGGKVSGGVEFIDLDLKYDITGTLYKRYTELIEQKYPELLQKLIIQKTKNGGYHFMYRCPQPGGNEKLASRHATIEEKKSGELEKVLIETRGQGGYALIDPSEGYELIQGKWTSPPRISQDERDWLINCAVQLNEVIELIQAPLPPHKERGEGLSPLDDYNQRGDVVGLLIKYGWKIVKELPDKVLLLRPGDPTSSHSGNFNHKLNLFSVFSGNAAPFQTGKGYCPYAVYTTLVHNGDFKAATKDLAAQGYGEQKTIYTAPTTTKLSIKKFWNAYLNDKEQLKIHFEFEIYRQWLTQHGFGKYEYAEGKYIFIRIENNIIKNVNITTIREFTWDYLLTIKLDHNDHESNHDLTQFVGNGIEKFISNSILLLLPTLHPNFNKDTQFCAYYYFKSKAVAVTKDAITELNYSELPGPIWYGQILDRDIDLTYPAPEHSDFEIFIQNVCGDDTKIASAKATLGYLLHNYKNPAFCPAVILNDEIISDSPEGGTGKGIFIRALTKFKKTASVDGKNFKFDKQFAFQSVDLDTQILAFEDIVKDFNFEKLFSIITEGIMVEKKNKQEFYIPFESAPKIIISTNYTVKGSGNSNERRRLELEFRQHYNDVLTPEMDFGRRLFDDWSYGDWQAFYRFMFACVQHYLCNGVAIKLSENLLHKKVLTETSKEFVGFMEGLKLAGQHNKKELYAQFIEAFPDWKQMKQRTFSTWVTKYCKYRKIKLTDKRSNGADYFVFECTDEHQSALPGESLSVQFPEELPF